MMASELMADLHNYCEVFNASKPAFGTRAIMIFPKQELRLDALQHRACDQRQPHRCVEQHFRKFATLFWRNKLAPRNRFAIGATGEPSPIDWLGTDANAIMKALERQVFPTAAMPQIDIRAKLLRPVARHSAANREDAQAVLLQQSLGIELQIFEGIVAQ